MALNTIDDQINRIETAKANLKTSIVNKGVSIPDTALLNDYSFYVDKISTGIVPTGNIELTAQSGTNVSAYATASVRPASINIDNISFSQSNIGNNLTVTKSSNPSTNATSTDISIAVPVKVAYSDRQNLNATVTTTGWVNSLGSTANPMAYGEVNINANGYIRAETNLTGLSNYFNAASSGTDLKISVASIFKNTDGTEAVRVVTDSQNYNIKEATTNSLKTSGTSTDVQIVSAAGWINGIRYLDSLWLSEGQIIRINDTPIISRASTQSLDISTYEFTFSADTERGDQAYIEFDTPTNFALYDINESVRYDLIVDGEMFIAKYYTGTTAPASSLGQNGDIYFKTE